MEGIDAVEGLRAPEHLFCSVLQFRTWSELMEFELESFVREESVVETKRKAKRENNSL